MLKDLPRHHHIEGPRREGKLTYVAAHHIDAMLAGKTSRRLADIHTDVMMTPARHPWREQTRSACQIKQSRTGPMSVRYEVGTRRREPVQRSERPVGLPPLVRQVVVEQWIIRGSSRSHALPVRVAHRLRHHTIHALVYHSIGRTPAQQRDTLPFWLRSAC